MKRPIDTRFQHAAKPTAQQHAKRREQKLKFDKPLFNPAETDRWIDRHGRFTIPHNKGERK